MRAAAAELEAAGGDGPPVGTKAIRPGCGYEWVHTPHWPDAAGPRNPEGSMKRTIYNV